MGEYYNQIKTFSSDELYKGMLGYGMFAEKIPPFLSSVKFYEFVSEKNPAFEKKEHDYIRYDNMRNINVPRQLSIPHPFAYALLCKNLADSWPALKKHFKTQTNRFTHKISKIHIRKIKNEDKLFEMNYKSYYDESFTDINLLIGSRYLAIADISNCFPSIYSHSIPWALVSKSTAKEKMGNKYPKEWFNKIDFYLRNTKNAETNGILIGPHSSNLISEIVLSVIDSRLYSKGYKFTRFIDDYHCYSPSRDAAEQFLIDLSTELKEFELSLNHKKSKISQLPLATSDKWVRKLNHYRFSYYIKNDKKYLSIKELESFLDMAIELMSISGDNTAILNYALKKLSKKKLESSTKQYFIKRVHHLVLIYPYLVQVLDNSVFQAFKYRKKDILPIASDLFTHGIKTKMYEACSYGLYFAIKYGFTFESGYSLEQSIESNDCIFLLLTYIYEKKQDNDLGELISKAKELKETDFDRFWLFIYEVLPVGEFEKCFVQMKKEKVTFIKPEFL